MPDETRSQNELTEQEAIDQLWANLHEYAKRRQAELGPTRGEVLRGGVKKVIIGMGRSIVPPKSKFSEVDKDAVPPEVQKLWAQLYDEANRRMEYLDPGYVDPRTSPDQAIRDGLDMIRAAITEE